METRPNDEMTESPDAKKQSGAKGALYLAAVLFVLLLAAVLFGGLLPSGVDDVTFEYEAVLNEAVYDEDGHIAYLRTALVSDGSELIVLVQRGQKAVTATGKTAFKNLETGTLLFISADCESGEFETDPPRIQADVVMAKG